MSEKSVIFSCCGAVVFLAAVIMLACCWDTVEPTEYGIIYNTLSKKLEGDKTYTGGRYFVGLTSRFVTFPSTVIQIEFSDEDEATTPPLKTRTKEGLESYLSFSFQVELIRPEIDQLYTMTNGNYMTTFTKIAKDTINEVSGNYEAQSYWLERDSIAEDYKTFLNQAMKSAHATVSQVQILKIVLPTNYEQKIVDTQVEVQKKKTKEYEREATLIRKSIDIDISEADRRIKVINAQAKATSFEITQNAVSTQLKETIDIEADCYSKTKKDLGFSSAELNQYIYYVSVMGKEYTLLSGLDNAIVKLD